VVSVRVCSCLSHASVVDLIAYESQSAFINEEVEGILQSVVDEVLEKKEYKEEDVPSWIDAICDGVMARLAAVKPFKYIVHCTIA